MFQKPELKLHNSRMLNIAKTIQTYDLFTVFTHTKKRKKHMKRFWGTQIQSHVQNHCIRLV